MPNQPDCNASDGEFTIPGDSFGELAVVDEAPRGHLAVAHEDVVLCAVPRDVLLRLITQTPSLGYRITKLMGFRLRRLQTRVEELLFKSAHARAVGARICIGSRRKEACR